MWMWGWDKLYDRGAGEIVLNVLRVGTDGFGDKSVTGGEG